MKTLEQRVKDALGELQFALIALQQQLEEAQAKLAEKDKPEAPAEEKSSAA